MRRVTVRSAALVDRVAALIFRSWSVGARERVVYNGIDCESVSPSIAEALKTLPDRLRAQRWKLCR